MPSASPDELNRLQGKARGNPGQSRGGIFAGKLTVGTAAELRELTEMETMSHIMETKARGVQSQRNGVHGPDPPLD